MTEAELSIALQRVCAHHAVLCYRNSQVRVANTNGKLHTVKLDKHEIGRPDWCLKHPGWCVEVELKGPSTRLTREQKAHLKRFSKHAFLLRAGPKWTETHVEQALRIELAQRGIEL